MTYQLLFQYFLLTILPSLTVPELVQKQYKITKNWIPAQKYAKYSEPSRSVIGCSSRFLQLGQYVSAAAVVSRIDNSSICLFFGVSFPVEELEYNAGSYYMRSGKHCISFCLDNINLIDKLW